MAERIQLSYFSDVLCVWAYVAQVRLDELLRRHGENLEVRYHFLPIFGATEHRFGEGWKDRGGFEGYADHVAEVCDGFDHAALHPEAWRSVRPVSCGPSHQFLKALQVVEAEGIASREPIAEYDGRTLFEETMWTLRRAFFEDGKDIARFECLWDATIDLGLPVEAMREALNDGRAFAGVLRDAELRDEHRIDGSPTYLLNSGRQKLYGNVGYKIIEANVEEVLSRPEGGASWC